jgi:hypothetical protein
LWGSQSWLQPAFSRLASHAKAQVYAAGNTALMRTLLHSRRFNKSSNVFSPELAVERSHGRSPAGTSLAAETDAPPAKKAA